MEAQFNRYPTYKDAYIKTFGRMLQRNKSKGISTKWTTGQEVFNWWMGYDDLDLLQGRLEGIDGD